MVVNNAITEVFDNANIREHYGLDKSRVMCGRMLAMVTLDQMHDAPLPQWFIDICNANVGIGWKEKVRIALIHHGDITGMPVDNFLVKGDGKMTSWYSRRAAQLNRKALKKMKEEETNNVNKEN